ncbi:hypothetical protein K438DRAFT_1971663 [Mycena galopus ATCC 62051]|nr:hypothetical protein K438DRAFT_1971663 [Mycena galopus ATCC 62051]
MKLLSFVSAVLATLAVADAMSVDTQNVGLGQLKPEINKDTEETKDLSSASASNDSRRRTHPSYTHSSGLSRRGDLLGNVLGPLLLNLESAITSLLEYQGLKPIGGILANMHTMVK